MADVKISALPAAAALTGVEEIPAVQSATTVKTTPAAVATYTATLTQTLTGIPTWSNVEPRLILSESDQASNEKLWDFDVSAKTFTLRTRTDADGAGVNALSIVRGTGTALASLSFGNATNNPTYTFLGTGTTTFSGAVTTGTSGFSGGRYIASSGGSVPSNGMYLAGTNRLGFSTNSTQAGEFDASRNFVLTTVGAGLQIKEGSNAKMGTATLVGGTVTVNTTAVTANSRILLTCQSLGTVAVPSGYCVSARTAGTSFTILASAPTDTSVIAWMLFEPSP